MRFRILFVVFNLVILASFAAIFLMPAIVLGWEYTRIFWSGNWPIAAVFVSVLGGLNGYFIYHWKLFTLLEQEDWSGLVSYLEQRVFQRRRVSRQHLNVLINGYVVTGVPQRITRIEEFLVKTRPRLVPRLAPELGVPYLLANDAEAMERFFAPLVANPRTASPLWIRWNHGLALRLLGRTDEARGQFVAVLESTRNPLERLLSAYLLDMLDGNPDDVTVLVRKARSELAAAYSRDAWERKLESMRQSLQVLVLASLTRSASDWAWGNGEA